MVNYGADEIFKVGASNGVIQDEDIEELIAKGLEKADKM